VKVAMDLLSEPNISKDIIHLTSYHTRYHASKEGLETMQWIYSNWKELTAHRSDVNIEYYKHKESPQPSVILTIKGKSDKRIIVGGHADSINTDDEGVHSHAPGANDNAAGIGVLNEILRVLMKTNFKPTKTVQFIAYAAEEVGILGSYEIAREYAKKDIEVDGVLQIDGVNYKGTTYDMALIDDNTSKKQNNFLAMIIDEYLKVNWGYVPCGYGCSDHAAWNYESYHASFPVDAIPSEQNPHEHTAEDTFDKSNNNAVHALMFAKIGVAYTIELDNL
ncbi:M20/M25/M40 family metallo-hydrolase, partial [Halobacteriovorax sp.]|uniref:M20/M25/M40 family metallo-hydrolase n=1 Tax=Halobacteriovorax sp. TaxID=2020862 RepID=UPI003562BCB9